MKIRVVALETLLLRSGVTVGKGREAYVEEDEAAALIAEKKASDRVAGAARSGAILPDKPEFSADKKRCLP